ELECGTVKLIGPGPGRQVDDAAVETPELRWRAVGFDLELLNRIHIWKECHLPGLRLQDRDAVEQMLVGPGPSAVDARERRRRGWRKRDARDEAGERDEATAVEREI